MEIGVTGSGRLQRPDRLAGISEASNSIGAVALIQLITHAGTHEMSVVLSIPDARVFLTIAVDLVISLFQRVYVLFSLFQIRECSSRSL